MKLTHCHSDKLPDLIKYCLRRLHGSSVGADGSASDPLAAETNKGLDR